ncbi:cAMP-binding protein [Leptospira ryugenii]|uniref:cAMP-binding protein n=1 Tax=Leptospira ryugenii TaxID=1917863 RepID=A0A2P2E0G2_9LEPT|nr:hypothetical protein [Leptospira ryugenii]GBF50359.1 cAMP-binding protein [Leptospira ryugenii]
MRGKSPKATKSPPNVARNSEKPSFVSGYPSDERLVSFSDSELLRISKSDLYKFFDERPEIGRFVLNVKILASYLGMEPETFSKSLAQLT